MLQNVGTTDRGIRTIAGVVLIVGAFFVQGLWHWIALPGIILLLTALAGTCPVYLPFNIRTNDNSRS